MINTKNNLDGWLVINKPYRMGSTQVVGRLKHLLHPSTIGHAGTLDPLATGVLPIALGKATRLIPFVMDDQKTYEFTIQWGRETDSDDLAGKEIATSSMRPQKQEILSVLPKLTGQIMQTPNAFSAIKINGQRAYDLARQGENVTIPERKIHIFELELLEMIDDSQAKLRVTCSKGTYVRTLGADIAKSLGTYGYLTTLRRTKCGNFSLADTILLENLKNIEYVGERQEKILPILTCLCDITVIAVKEEDATKLRQGQGISPKSYEISTLMGKDAVATLDNQPVAVVRIDEKKIFPIRVFNLNNE